MAEKEPTNNEIIRDLYKFQMNIKKADELSIDYETSELYCYIQANKFLSDIFNNKVDEYKKLREDESFQDLVLNFFKKVKEHKRNDIEIYSYNIFTPIVIDEREDDTNIKKTLTLLYLWSVDEFIELLSTAEQELLKIFKYKHNLIDRNLGIYCSYTNNSSLKQIFYDIKSRIYDTYSFHFFSIEKSLDNIDLIEQIQIASNDIIKYFIKELQRQCNNKEIESIKQSNKIRLVYNYDFQEFFINNEKLNLEPAEIEVLKCIYPGLTSTIQLIDITSKQVSSINKKARAMCNHNIIPRKNKNREYTLDVNRFSLL